MLHCGIRIVNISVQVFVMILLITIVSKKPIIFAENTAPMVYRVIHKAGFGSGGLF